MAQIDLGPAAQAMNKVISNVPDDMLGAPTPCRESTVGDLIDHVSGFARAFTNAARKSSEGTQGAPPDAANLGADWRTRIPAELDALADAWRDPEAWTGMTNAGGLEFPGQVVGAIAVDELVVHGWDIARASGQPFDADPEALETALEFVKPLQESGEPPRPGLFDSPVPVPGDASALDRLIGLTGRDPGWSPG